MGTCASTDREDAAISVPRKKLSSPRGKRDEAPLPPPPADESASESDDGKVSESDGGTAVEEGQVTLYEIHAPETKRKAKRTELLPLPRIKVEDQLPFVAPPGPRDFPWEVYLETRLDERPVLVPAFHGALVDGVESEAEVMLASLPETSQAAKHLNINPKWKASDKDVDWNARFQELAEQPVLGEGDLRQRHAKLSALVERFAFFAKKVALRIIHEKDTSMDEVTIKPEQSTRHGDVYKCGHVTFLLALDNAKHYGGDRVDAVQKSALNELRATREVLELATHGLALPLGVCVRAHGQCVSAWADIPSSKDTVVYGSADGGRTVHNASQHMRELVAELANTYNLRMHVVEAPNGVRTELELAGDVQGHYCAEADGRYYLTHLRRFCPPVCAGTIEHPHACFYMQFRPEFLQIYCSHDTALSPDAFTSFGNVGSSVHDPAARGAYQYLLSAVVPLTAADLASLAHSSKEQLVTYTQHAATVDNEVAVDLADFLHSRGVNCRYLGWVRECILPEGDDARALRSLLLRDMLCRAVKARHRRYCRDVLPNKQTGDLPFMLLAMRTLRLLLSDSADSKMWRKVLPSELRYKFAVDVEDDEMDELHALLTKPSDNETLVHARLMHELLASVQLRWVSKTKSCSAKSLAAVLELTDPLDLLRSVRPTVVLDTIVRPDFQGLNDASTRLHERLALRQRALGGDSENSGLLKTMRQIIRLHEIEPDARDRMPLSSSEADLSAEFVVPVAATVETVVSIARSGELPAAEVDEALNQAAGFYKRRGKLEKSAKLLTEALEVCETTLGADSVHTASSANNLAIVKAQSGHVDEAVPLYEKALRIYKAQLGEKHPSYVDTLQNLANALEQQGRVDKAEALFKQVLKLRGDSADALVALAGIARSRSTPEGDDRAVELLKQALEIETNKHGDTHPHTLHVELQLAIALEWVASDEEALAHFSNVSNELVGVCGLGTRGGSLKQHDDFQISTAKLVEGLLEKRDAEAAAQALQHLLASCKRTPTKQLRRELADTLNNVGVRLKVARRYKLAEQAYRVALDVRLAKQGPDSLDASQSFLNLGKLYDVQERLEDAISFYERSLAIRERVLGDADARTAAACDALGLACAEIDNPRAVRLCERAVAIAEEVLGAEHKHAELFRHNLEYVRQFEE